MKVIDYKVGRIVPIEANGQYQVGQVLFQPQPKINPNYSPRKLMIENIFENVRNAKFPHLPSRKSSLFVFPMNEVKYEEEWLNILYPHRNAEYVLLTLSLTGELLWFDSDFYNECQLYSNNIPKLREQASQYWKPIEDYLDLPQIEGLFIGTAIVENIEVKTRYQD